MGNFQDRLTSELRLAGDEHMAGANQVPAARELDNGG